ncbi:TetR/AcrR family transcriptional regulator [Pseudomonadota bacterium]
MARPQEFNRNDVLDQALLVFWKKGFEATSVQDLVDATGLNRGSLYNTFGDKAELFAEVMEHYRAASPTKPLVQAVQDPHGDINVRDLIGLFFSDLVKRAQNDFDHKGCLMTNTSAGFYGCDETMAQWVRDSFAGLEDTLTTLIARGQKQGSVTSTAKPRALARALVASAQGFNVIARGGAKPQALKDIAAQAVHALDH